jgi:hypothetical protein
MVVMLREGPGGEDEARKRKERMNRNRLRPMYASLTEEERFRLVVQTGGAGDHAEAMHLTRSCPQVELTGADPSFAGPGMASHRLAWAFAQTAWGYLGWISAMEVVEQLLTGESGRAVVRQEARVPVALALEETVATAAFGLRALLDAFEQVCRSRAGLPSRAVLAFWIPYVAAALAEAEPLIDGLQPEPALTEAFRAGLDRHWTLETEEA